MKTTFIVQTDDNVTLSVTHSYAQNAKAVVLINPGTATKTSFYVPFSEFLVSHGYHVVLWNYRGFCDSKTTELKLCSYQYSDIGRYDIPAVIEHVKSYFPHLPLYCVGHSAGGQQLGIAKNCNQIDAFFAIAVSAGYFPAMPLSYRVKANFFFRIFAPFTGAIFNFIPAKKFRMMEDLPVEFTREWSSWCKERNLFFSEKFYGKSVPISTFQDFNIPIFVFTADDDEICTEQNLTNFWSHVSSDKVITFRRYKVSELPSKSIGHFGYFRKSNQLIWDDILSTINRVYSST